MVETALCARFALGAIFIVAGLSKLNDRASFNNTVRDFGFINPRYTGHVSIALPILEIFCGLSMAVGLFTPVATVAIIALTLAFTLLIITLILRGRVVRCACFGSTSRNTTSWPSVARNMAIIFGALLVYAWGQPVLALDALREPISADVELTNSDGIALMIATTSLMLAGLIAQKLRHLQSIVVTKDQVMSR